MNLEFIDENARMSFDDNEESMETTDFYGENQDSGFGTISREGVSTLTSMFGFLNSPSAANKTSEFSAILVSFSILFKR